MVKPDTALVNYHTCSFDAETVDTVDKKQKETTSPDLDTTAWMLRKIIWKVYTQLLYVKFTVVMASQSPCDIPAFFSSVPRLSCLLSHLATHFMERDSKLLHFVFLNIGVCLLKAKKWERNRGSHTACEPLDTHNPYFFLFSPHHFAQSDLLWCSTLFSSSVQRKRPYGSLDIHVQQKKTDNT